MLDSAVASTSPRKLAWHLRHIRDRSAENFLVRIIDEVSAGRGAHSQHRLLRKRAWNSARRIPLVHTIRDYFLLCTNSGLFRAGGNCERQCMPCKVLRYPMTALARKPDAFVGVSEAVLEIHRRMGGIDASTPTHVIHNSPSLHPVSPSRPARPCASDSWGTSTSAKGWTSSSRLSPVWRPTIGPPLPVAAPWPRSSGRGQLARGMPASPMSVE